MSDTPLIEVKDLSRRYKSSLAVKHINFELNRGEVLGFLGPNGAGKSTTMNMITGNLAPTTGSIKINHFDLLDQPKQAKLHLGYLPENVPLYPELTVEEFLRFCAKINRLEAKQVNAATDRAIARCGLDKMRRRLIQNLSKGYQQRVGIAQAIIHSPAVIILDEPTVGLDPIQIREIRNLIRELGEEHSVILSTHILPEVQIVCDRVQIINQGTIVFNDSLTNLEQKTQSHQMTIATQQQLQETDIVSLPYVSSCILLEDGRWKLTHEPQTNAANDIAKAILDKNWGLIEIAPVQHSLEQIFVDIISHEQDQQQGDAA